MTCGRWQKIPNCNDQILKKFQLHACPLFRFGQPAKVYGGQAGEHVAATAKAGLKFEFLKFGVCLDFVF